MIIQKQSRQLWRRRSSFLSNLGHQGLDDQ